MCSNSGNWELGIGNWELELLKNQCPKVYNNVLRPGSNAQNGSKPLSRLGLYQLVSMLWPMPTLRVCEIKAGLKSSAGRVNNITYAVCIKRERQTVSFCIRSSRCFFTSRQTISYLLFRCTLQDARITHLGK